MEVTVLLFASHREAVGAGRVELDLPDASTVEDAYCSLQNDHAGLAPLRRFTSFAVNREMVEPSTHLSPGDEIAFLQPVSGGVA
jgi:molybdopterin converting factor small subunit